MKLSFVRVSYPEYNGLVMPQLLRILLINETDLLPANNHPLQENGYLFLVVPMDLLRH